MEGQDQFQEAATILLNAEHYPLLQNIAHAQVLVRVWTWPTFSAWLSWTLIESKMGLHLRRIIWTKRSHPGTPINTVGSEIMFPRPRWQALEAAAQKITATPFKLTTGMGRDGTQYGLEMQTALASARLAWWETLPDGWASVGEWHTQAVKQFQELLPMTISK